MATIDINQYIEQSGMRKARFGGYEPDDVRQAMLDLCSDYEQRLNTAAQQVRGAQQEAEALRRRCQTLIGQNQNLATQNASLAGKADRIARMQSDMETRYSKVQERNHSLTDQVAMLRLKNTDLELKNKELTERAENADAALRIKGREHDQAKQQVLAERDSVVAGAQKEAARIRSQAREEADQLLKDTNLKAEAIDQLAREQAIGQARKMVQAATEETREIQNAHRLRLQDLQSRIDAMEQQVRARLQAIADNRGLSVTITPQWISPATPFDAECVACVQAAVDGLGYSQQTIVSGAGHDAIHLARYCPTAMIFIPCVGGLSHNEAEDVLPDDVRQGTDVLLNAVLKRAGHVHF